MLEENSTAPAQHDRNPRANNASIGNWECQLPCETLVWSDEVYDLFELPRGMRITRTEAVGFYTEESRRTLEKVRTLSIFEGGGFTLDADIVTALGKTRRMRITAAVERKNDIPVRLVGTKEDITTQAGPGQTA